MLVRMSTSEPLAAIDVLNHQTDQGNEKTVAQETDQGNDKTSAQQTDKRNKDTFAQKIDASVWFHMLYGVLDGLSVSYSTVKFLCEVLCPAKMSPREALEHVLTDPELWLPLIAINSLLITSISLLGNRCGKIADVAQRTLIDKQCKAYWPYLRNILKGVKNGYKGIKSLTTLLVQLKVLEKANFSAFALPVGLTIGLVGMLNRLYNMYINDQRKKLGEKGNEIKTDMHHLNELHLQAYDLETDIFTTQYALNEHHQKCQDIENKTHQQALTPEESQRMLAAQNEKLAELETQLLQLTEKLAAKRHEITMRQAQLAQPATTKDNHQLREQKDQVTEFLEEEQKIQLKNNFRMLLSNFIGGVADGPYLYVGIIGLTSLSGLMLVAMSSIIAVFLVGCMASRTYEEVEKQQALRQVALDIQAAKAYQEYITSYRKYLALLQRCKLQNPAAEDIWLIRHNKHLREARAAVRNDYRNYTMAREEQKYNLRPTNVSAILGGLEDGLKSFGAVASTYFAISIILTLCGQTFPPALVVGGFLFGLIAITGFIAYRLCKTHDQQRQFDARFERIKSHEEQTLSQTEINEVLNPMDWNSDGLKKGEFYFQQTAEVVRSFSGGPYKSQNLTDFFLTTAGEHDVEHKTSAFNTLFWGSLSVIYGLCLALRAYGSGFGKIKAKKEPSSLPHTEGPKTPVAPSSPSSSTSSEAPLSTSPNPLPSSEDTSASTSLLSSATASSTSSTKTNASPGIARCIYTLFNKRAASSATPRASGTQAAVPETNGLAYEGAECRV